MKNFNVYEYMEEIRPLIKENSLEVFFSINKKYKLYYTLLHRNRELGIRINNFEQTEEEAIEYAENELHILELQESK